MLSIYGAALATVLYFKCLFFANRGIRLYILGYYLRNAIVQKSHGVSVRSGDDAHAEAGRPHHLRDCISTSITVLLRAAKQAS